MRTLLFFCCLAAFWQCQSKGNQNAGTATPSVAAADLTEMVKTTHAEARDTLLADTTAPLKPIAVQPVMVRDSAWKTLAGLKLGELFVVDWPDNGFYGDERRRIEFIFTSVERSFNDPFVYAVKGKNRYKTTISDFTGLFEIKEVARFTDPNLDTEEVEDMNVLKTYALTGEFRFDEDRSLSTSGQFAGTFKMDIGVSQFREPSLWFFSKGTPADGCGYRFDGTWTSYPKPDMKRSVIWSRDLFSFANDILSEFSYGERDVEINEKYRNLGWDTFWDGEEWWHEGKKKEM